MSGKSSMLCLEAAASCMDLDAVGIGAVTL